jgi:hypothetical protein
MKMIGNSRAFNSDAALQFDPFHSWHSNVCNQTGRIGKLHRSDYSAREQIRYGQVDHFIASPTENRSHHV